MPRFDSGVTSYTAITTNATNKITATATNEGAAILIEVNGNVVGNGSSASWQEGENEVVVTLGSTVYTVIVTKE